MISVCMATHNGEKYLYQQLSSILSQLSENDEIIISDDGSTDATISIINSFGDNRIKLLHYRQLEKKNQFQFSYVTRNFENALKHVQGDIIILSDQDDVWMNNKVQTSLLYLNSNYDLIISDCIVVNASLKVLNSSYYQYRPPSKNYFHNLIKTSYLGCCMAFRKKILDIALPFPDNVPHDLWIGMVSEVYGNVCFINESLIMYRRHENTVTFSGSKSTNSLKIKLSYRFVLVWEFLKRWLEVKIGQRRIK